MRKILYLIDGLEGGGAERQFCELVRASVASDRFEARVALVQRRPGRYEWLLERDGIEFVRIYRRSRLDLIPLLRVIRYVRRNRIDLIHAFKPLGGDLGVAAAKLCGIPVVCSSIRNAKDPSWKDYLRIRCHALFADRLVANSSAGLRERFRRVRSKFVAIPNGVDPKRFDIDQAARVEIRKELDIADDRRVLCMAAAFTRKKDHATLVRALGKIVARHSNCLLLLVGEGPTRPAVERQVAQAGLSEHVRFLGFLSEVERVLAIAEVSILLTDTDRHLEGISNTLIESMALGVPVIATSGGGTDEVIEDGLFNGIRVRAHRAQDVAEGVRFLLESPGERRRMIDNGRHTVAERFGIERFLASYERTYEELLGRNGG